MIAKNILLLMVTVGCGSIEIPKTEIIESSGTCGQGERICSTTDTAKEAENIEDEGIDYESYTDAPEIDKSSEDRHTGQTGDEGEILDFFVSWEKMTQKEHLENADQGYELATRAQLSEILDGDELDYVNESDIFWTKTNYEQSEEMAWTIGKLNAITIPKTLKFPAVYVQYRVAKNL